MNKLVIGLETLVILLICNSSFAANPAISFFDQRYRGWLWFENKTTIHNNTAQTSGINQAKQNDDITPAQAKAEVEQFARELEALKFMMLARPTVENVKAYRDKEKLMWQQAETLHDSWDMANLLYPEQRDLINNPVNVHGVKAKREMVLADNAEQIKKFAQSFDLVLFFSSTCKYCQLLSPVLKAFGERYGFNIDAISSDHTSHEYFKTVDAPGLVERLGITAFPTVIAVSHDSKTAFELIRGYVSQSELEDYSMLAIKYLESSENKQQISNSLISNNLAK